MKELNASDWKIRNVAVKELGKEESLDNLNTLITLVKDRRPALWWQKLLGEPYHQVGFIRRNAWRALEVQGMKIENIEEILPLGIHDPYYEVRAQVYLTLFEQVDKFDLSIPDDMRKMLIDHSQSEANFEVIVNSLKFFAKVAEAEELNAVVELRKHHSNWRVREGVLKMLMIALTRKVIDKSYVKKHLGNMNLLTEYFKPVFSLQQQRVYLESRLQEAQ